MGKKQNWAEIEEQQSHAHLDTFNSIVYGNDQLIRSLMTSSVGRGWRLIWYINQCTEFCHKTGIDQVNIIN
jgi:hypothetical protein